MFRGTLERGTILIVFKNRLKNIFKGVAISGAILSTTVLHANSDGVKYDPKQVKCLVDNTYYESRGEPKKGQIAVVHTVLNRVKDGRFQDNPCAVVKAKGQFEWIGKAKPVKEHDTYQETKELVLEVLSGKHRDPTQGSLYFNSHHKQPKGTRCTIRIGNHSFYKPINKPIKKEKQL